MVSVAPTVMTYGSSPGDVTPSSPLFPADATTVIPDAHAASDAASSGFTTYGSGASSPKERLSTPMLYVSRFVTTQPMPAITRESVVEPSASATFTDTSVAPGATPKCRAWAPELAVPSPAMSPAMNVPWP